MADRIRRRMRYFCTHGQPWGPWHCPSPPYGPIWGWGRWQEPSVDEEKDFLDEYIAMLKEGIERAEEYRKELEASK
jgi:hypothetical protein